MYPQIRIGDRLININSDCFIIAEIGNNHQGDMEKARQMFAAAKECGADAVKLQKRDNRSLYTREMFNKPYDHENSFGPTYGAHREALEFGRKQYEELQGYAKELGLVLFATAFDMPSADFLAELDMPVYKIASGDLTNIPLLQYVAKIGKPMIVSTGGATMEDVRRAYDAIMAINPQLCLLQCTAAYPASHEDLNLRVLTTYQQEFPDAIVGLSDHENGIAMAVAAYVLGARVVEKHFTLNHTWKGTDHAFSLEPAGFKKLVRDLRRVPVALGDGRKKPLPHEKSPIMKMGKKLVAARDLPMGHRLTEKDIAFKSPGDGVPPYKLNEVLGMYLMQGFSEDQDISLEMLSREELSASAIQDRVDAQTQALSGLQGAMHGVSAVEQTLKELVEALSGEPDQSVKALQETSKRLEGVGAVSAEDKDKVLADYFGVAGLSLFQGLEHGGVKSLGVNSDRDPWQLWTIMDGIVELRRMLRALPDGPVRAFSPNVSMQQGMEGAAATVGK